MGTNVAGANPITWLVSVQDNFSPGGVTLAAVVTDPSGATAPVTPVALGGGMFSIALHAGNVPALASMDGAYQIALTATDQAGNQRTAPGSAMAPFQPIRFTLRVLGGPLQMESQAITAPPSGSGYVLTAGRTLQANNVAAVFAAGPKKVVVGKVRVYNGTTTPTFVITTSTATADFNRIVYDVNVQFQSLDDEGPFCNPNAFSPPTTTGTCLASVPTDSRPASPTPMNNVSLVTDMLAFTSTNAAATPCSGMGCGASQFEWLVPGASGGVAGFIDVYLLADGFSAMWDGSVSSVGQALGDNTITVAGAGTWNLFGFKVFDWGQNDMFNPIIIRKSRIKYLKRFEVFANESIDEVGFQVELGAANAAWMPDAVAPIDLDFSWIIDEMTGGP
jgi:hypothetical protein